MPSYTEQLKLCTNAEDVLELMLGRVYENSDGSLFEDEILQMRSNAIKFSPVTLDPIIQTDGDLDIMILAIRAIIFLKLDDKIGQTPINGGSFHYVKLCEQVMRELKEHGNFSKPSELSGSIIDSYIIEQRNIGNIFMTIKSKLFKLKEWHEYNHLLPFFLQLPYDLFEQSKQWDILVKDAAKEMNDYHNGLGGSKEPYPLDQWAILITEAINYIEDHAEDCLIAARIYKEIKSDNSLKSDTARVTRFTKHLRTPSTHQFTEPQLKKVQLHALSLPNNRWEAMPGSNKNNILGGPPRITAMRIRKLQGACVIIILILTAMRKGELEVMMRYPKVKKSAHHDLDGSLELHRIIYKTAQSDQGEVAPISVPPIVVKAFDLLSQISELMDGKKEGVINISGFGNYKEMTARDRIQNLIEFFSEDIDVNYPPTPHQLRHALAFLISFLNDDIGIELAMHLLGHKSVAMTHKYMGHYKKLILDTYGIMFDENERMKEAIEEFQNEASKKDAEEIISSIEKDEPLMGPIAKRMLAGYEFQGSITNDGKVFFAKSLRTLVERGQIAVIQQATHFCVRDKIDDTQLPCQMGIVSTDFSKEPVIASQCQTNCGNRLYTAPQVEQLVKTSQELEDYWPDDLVDIIKDNTYYMETALDDSYIKQLNEEYQAKIKAKEDFKHAANQ